MIERGSATDELTKTRMGITSRVMSLGAVAVIRLRDGRHAMRVIEAIHAGGIAAIEITVTTPGAIAMIAEVSRQFGDSILLGVGSVLDAATARQSVEAGARFVVSPVFRSEVLSEAHRLGVSAMPGAFTPTEMFLAHDAGADIVKIFPAETIEPSFIAAVHGPMPFLRLMPTGGVTPENAGRWIRAGAVAVGIGSALVNAAAIAAGDFASITARTRTMVAAIAEARVGNVGGAS